uniref:Uncharacterized protein n=1 Tax=Oryza nivara TaxID=4536 RepID=A0A0E0ISR6_ORYNI
MSATSSISSAPPPELPYRSALPELISLVRIATDGSSPISSARADLSHFVLQQKYRSSKTDRFLFKDEPHEGLRAGATHSARNVSGSCLCLEIAHRRVTERRRIWGREAADKGGGVASDLKLDCRRGLYKRGWEELERGAGCVALEEANAAKKMGRWRCGGESSGSNGI